MMDFLLPTCRTPAMIEVLEKPAAGMTIRLHENDNVVIARTDVPLGAKLESLGGIAARGQVPAGHKIAARARARWARS